MAITATVPLTPTANELTVSPREWTAIADASAAAKTVTFEIKTLGDHALLRAANAPAATVGQSANAGIVYEITVASGEKLWLYSDVTVAASVVVEVRNA